MTFVLNLLLASTGSLAFAILYNVPRKFYLCAAFTGMAGWFCYYLIVPFTDTAVASFFGAVGVVLVSRIFAVWKKCPITVFLISGIFPLVPGAGVYYTMYYLVSNELTLAAIKGLESLKIDLELYLELYLLLPFRKNGSLFKTGEKKMWRRNTLHHRESRFVRREK